MFDAEIDRVINGLDNVMANRIKQIDDMLAARLSQFQEMMNGIKITNQVEMPVVKKAEPA